LIDTYIALEYPATVMEWYFLGLQL